MVRGALRPAHWCAHGGRDARVETRRRTTCPPAARTRMYMYCKAYQSCVSPHLHYPLAQSWIIRDTALLYVTTHDTITHTTNARV